MSQERIAVEDPGPLQCRRIHRGLCDRIGRLALRSRLTETDLEDHFTNLNFVAIQQNDFSRSNPMAAHVGSVPAPQIANPQSDSNTIPRPSDAAMPRRRVRPPWGA